MTWWKKPTITNSKKADVALGFFCFLAIYIFTLFWEMGHFVGGNGYYVPSNIFMWVIGLHILPLVFKKIYVFLGIIILIIFSVGSVYTFYGLMLG